MNKGANKNSNKAEIDLDMGKNNRIILMAHK